jgi:uncharacterized Zn-binding protein involved in type VI secretion
MGMPAARIGDSTAHGGKIVLGEFTVLIGGRPAARLGDTHLCPPIHITGPVLPPCAINVLIGGRPAARIMDLCVCGCTVPDPIITGEYTVLIGTAGGGGGGGGALVQPDSKYTSQLPGFAGPGGEIQQFVQVSPQAASGAEPSPAPAPPPPAQAATPLQPPPQQQQVPTECQYLLNKPAVFSGPKMTGARWWAQRRLVRQSNPTAMQYSFPGDAQPRAAETRNVVVRGQTIQIISPTAGGAVTPDAAAQSLAVLPAAALKSINTVVLSPNVNPDDAYWAQQYNTPGFQSAATGGGGVVTYYPVMATADQQGMDSTMLHESGHCLSGKLYNNVTTPPQWQAAMTADNRSVSAYSDNATAEDFAESTSMYGATKGTSCEATARQLYPKRYEELDKLMEQKGLANWFTYNR